MEEIVGAYRNTLWWLCQQHTARWIRFFSKLLFGLSRLLNQNLRDRIVSDINKNVSLFWTLFCGLHVYFHMTTGLSCKSELSTKFTAWMSLHQLFLAADWNVSFVCWMSGHGCSLVHIDFNRVFPDLNGGLPPKCRKDGGKSFRNKPRDTGEVLQPSFWWKLTLHGLKRYNKSPSGSKVSHHWPAGARNRLFVSYLYFKWALCHVTAVTPSLPSSSQLHNRKRLRKTLPTTSTMPTRAIFILRLLTKPCRPYLVWSSSKKLTLWETMCTVTWPSTEDGLRSDGGSWITLLMMLKHTLPLTFPLFSLSLYLSPLSVRGCRPGKIVQMTEAEVRGLCIKSREIFLSQPILLELEAPLKICGQ